MPCFLVLRPSPLLNIQLRLASLSTFCLQLYTCMIRMVHDQFEFVVNAPLLQNLYLEIISQNPIPWCLAMSSSSALGWRLPSEPAIVPAPQGDPKHKHDISPSTGSSPKGKGGRTTVNLGQVSELGKRATVAERDKDDPVVRERGDRVADGRFLSTARRTRGDEHACKLARQGACGPEFTRGVPKGLSKGVIRSLATTRTPRRRYRTSTILTFHCAGKLP